MRDRFDPTQLEPKNGDFADFVDKLNQKSAEELKALQVNDALIREHANELQQSVADAQALQRQTMETKLGQIPPKSNYAWGKTDRSGPVIANREDAFKIDPMMQGSPSAKHLKKKSQSPIFFCHFHVLRSFCLWRSHRARAFSHRRHSGHVHSYFGQCRFANY